MQEELIVRFGELPNAAENLLRVALLKAEAHRAGITQIVQKTNQIRFYLKPTAKISSVNLVKMVESYEGAFKVVQAAKKEEQSYFIYTMKPQPQPAGISYRSGYGRIPAAVKVPSVSKTVSKQETAEKLFQTVNQLIREIGKVVE